MADNDVQIDSLSVKVEQSANDAAQSLKELASGLTSLKSAAKGLTKTANSLSKLNSALSGIPKDLSRLDKITKAFDALGKISTPKLSFINQLKKLPDVVSGLDTVELEKLRLKMAQLADAMRPLADEMDKVARGFSVTPARIRRLIEYNDKAAVSARKARPEWRRLFDEILYGSNRSRLGLKSLLTGALGILSVRSMFDFLGDSLNNVNDYIENLNLFSIALGKYTDEAFEYAEAVEASYGIDSSEWMRNQAVIMDMAKSFGVSTDAAYTMSKALTQLTYDFSSLYNVSTNDMALKVRSALSGEIEPIRALGKDLSVANLELIATEIGISNNIDAMTQAEKSMLRTVALLRQSESAMGDLGRTINQPANQMRILNQQMLILRRAVGELMLPLVQETLPYLTATVKVLRMITVEFARLAGFELPSFEGYDTNTEKVENLGETVEETSEAVKELTQLSFDQLNILGSPSKSGTAENAADMEKLLAELEKYTKLEDEAFSKGLEERTDKIAEALENWLTSGKGIAEWTGEIWETVEKIGRIAKALTPLFEGFGVGLRNVAEFIGSILGVTFKDADSFAQWLEDNDDALRKVGEVLAYVLVGMTAVKGVLGAADWLADKFGVDGLSDALKKLFGNTDEVNGVFGEKNKLLGEQTKATAAEVLEVGKLAVGLLGVGVTAMLVSRILKKSPLTPEIDADEAKEELGSIPAAALETKDNLAAIITETNTDTDLGLVKMLAIVQTYRKLINDESSTIFVDLDTTVGSELAEVNTATEAGLTTVKETAESGLGAIEIKFGEYGSLILSSADLTALGIEASAETSSENTEASWTTAFENMDAGLSSTSVSMLETSGSLGELLYNDIIGPIKDLDTETANIFNNIYKNFADLKRVLESDELVPYRATTYADTVTQTPGTLEDKQFEARREQFIKSQEANKKAYEQRRAEEAKATAEATESLSLLDRITVNAGLALDLFDTSITNAGKATGIFDQDVKNVGDGLKKFGEGLTHVIDKTLGMLPNVFGAFAGGLGAPAYATGGFPEDGFFRANSGELVGRFANGRTAVANNGQIIEGIRRGVYEAVYSAMSSANRGGESCIVLDGQVVGKAFGTAIDREKRRSGANTRIEIGG